MLVSILKISFPIITLIIALINLGLQHRWKDKRTKKHKIIKRFLIFSMVLTALLSIVFIKISENEFKQILNNQINLRIEAEARDSLARKQRDRLENRLTNIEKKFEPFVMMGKRIYPKKSSEEALNNILIDLNNLANSIKKTEARLNSNLISSISIEGRLTCSLVDNATLPPSEVEFYPIGDANAYFEGLIGRVRMNFQSPIQFKKIGYDKVTIINNFVIINDGILEGRPFDFLTNYDKLILPFITVVYGKSFSKMKVLEVTININGKIVWYSSWQYDVDFQPSPLFNIPLNEFHKKILVPE